MTMYIDFHAKLPEEAKTAEALAQFRGMLGKKDEFGCTPIDGFVTADGQGYCITEGPNPEAVCKSHEAHGLNLGIGDVHEIVAEAKQ